MTYDNILRISDDPDVNDVIKFLREREECRPKPYRKYASSGKAESKECIFYESVVRYVVIWETVSF